VGEAVIKWLYQVITRGDPRQLQFEFCLWTLAIVRVALKTHHNIELSKSSVSRLLAQMGITPQVPIYRSYRRSPSSIRYYLKERYPRAVALAKSLGAEIYFVDESRVRVDGHRGTTWAPAGKTPVVEDTGDRFGINLISAVSARGVMHFSCFEGRMNSERFISYLCDLRHDAGRPIVVIMDGGSYHTSKEVQGFACDPQRSGGIHLFRLPAYCPELNPDEQVWNHAKARLGKMFIGSKSALKSAVITVMSAIQQSSKLIKSFFQMKDTAYAQLPS
jgi:transposase